MAEEEVLHQTPRGFLLAEKVVSGSCHLLSEPRGPGRVPGHECRQGWAAGGQQSGRGGGHAVEHRLSHAGRAIEKTVGEELARCEETNVFKRAIVERARGDSPALSVERDGDDA